MNYAEISKETISLIYNAYNSLKQSPLDPSLRILLEVKTSQINGCAYCCTLHLTEARKQNISQQKLDLLPVWYSSKGVFSAKEQLALKWCEALTYCEHEEIEALKEEMHEEFSEREIVDITSTVSIMNALNRIAVSLR